MATTLPSSLVRTNYLDPTQSNYATDGNPNSAGYNPANVLPRAGATSHGESKVDADQYFRSIERLHGLGAHGAGVAGGLQVSATIGQPDVKIAPGIALDAAGKHIYVAVGGQAEIGPTADNPNVNPTLTAVAQTGIVLPTANFTGDYFVTVQWWETFDQATFLNSGGVVAQFNDTPWLRLVKKTDYNPDAQVVLARINLDNSFHVTSLTYGEIGGLQRFSVSLPAQRLQLRRAVNAAGPLADTVPWGEIRAREGGGLQVAVVGNNDVVELLRDDGTNKGNFNKMTVAAQHIVARRTDGIESVEIDTSKALVKVGAAGVDGDMAVINKAGNHVITLDSAGLAQVVVGGQKSDGKVRVKNGERGDRIILEGSTGNLLLGGDIYDIDNHFVISKSQLRELVAGKHTGLHTHFLGGLGWWGDTGSQIGTVGGWVTAKTGDTGPTNGGVTITFSDFAFSNGSGDFYAPWSAVHGTQAGFTATPSVIVSITAFDLTTSDVYSAIVYDVFPDHIDFEWQYNSGGGGFQSFDFLIIGPTSMK